MAAPIMGIIGAAITAYSQTRGYFEKGTPPLEWEYKESSVAQEYAKQQLEIARKLVAEITDPQAKKDIYNLLGDLNMTTEDFNAYTKEYGEIEEELIATGEQQAGMAVGKELTDLVSRGVISQETANEIKAKSTEYIDAIVDIGKKRIEADRIAMARKHWVDKTAAGIRGASALVDVYTSKLQTATTAINSALGSLLQGAAYEQGLTTEAAKQQAAIDLDTFFTKKEFAMGSLQAGLGMGGDIASTQRSSSWDYDWNWGSGTGVDYGGGSIGAGKPG
jgi:hypothetical protein